MLKITQNGPAAVLKLEGRVAGEWVSALRQICEPILDEGRDLKLDLSDVSFADPKGVDLLKQFTSRGATLLDCSSFVAEQLKTPQ